MKLPECTDEQLVKALGLATWGFQRLSTEGTEFTPKDIETLQKTRQFIEEARGDHIFTPLLRDAVIALIEHDKNYEPSSRKD